MYNLRYLTLSLLIIPMFLYGQLDQPKPALTADAPQWVQLMYTETPNAYAIQDAFDTYYKMHDFEENNYTRYFQRWAILARPYVLENGDVHFPTHMQLMREINSRTRSQVIDEGSRSTTWSFAGPDIHFTTKYDAGATQIPVSDHMNTYSFDRSKSNPNIAYCGGETGGIYKTTDQAMTWTHMTHGYYINTVRALAVDPFNPDIVIASSEGELWRTTDGGITWNIMGDAAFQAIYITAYDIVFNPENSNIVYAGCEQGFFRSTDGGSNWTEILDHFCMSVEVKPDNAAIVYTLQYDPTTQIPYFKKSFDYGATFTTYSDGWFTVPAADMGKIESLGGRIGVTEANPDKVYVLLVGESDADAGLQLRGTIGVYMSNDSGESWSFPHGLIGMPYNVDTHPNLMDFDGHSSDYDQIYYNTTIAVSQLDENKLLIGGLNLWKSEDGAVSYDPVGGYLGYLPYYHPDNQETKIYKTSPTTEEIWMATDGGVNYTTNWVESHESRSNGLRGSNFWGFDQGWQEDMMVGGRYHNGNGAYHENYPEGEFLALGGGEAASGYVKQSDENICMFSDIGGIRLPDEIEGIAEHLAFSNAPNESYWYNSSSRIQFDWDYFDHAYMGRDNIIWKSTDGGGGFTPLHEFGTNANNKVLWVEQSRVNTNIIYCTQNIGSTNCYLWKSTDRGLTWTNLTLPQAKRDLIFTLSGDNADELWIAYKYGPNGSKVYHSINGGDSWVNITTATLNDMHPSAIVHQYGTDGGVYVFMREAKVYYRTNTFIDWLEHGNDLPLVIDPLKAIPFYRDDKIRLGSWNIGIWEAPLYEPSALIADFSAEKPNFYCAGDQIKYVDHSTAGAGATYAWEFPGGIPATSSEQNPVVTYPTEGVFDATLTITDGAEVQSITKSAIVSSLAPSTLPFSENFETAQFPEGWHGGTSGGWGIAEDASAYDVGTYSMFFNNYWTDLQGDHVDEITAQYDIDAAITAQLTFDVAYRPYGGIYMDTLAVYVSNDCGATLDRIYYKGGNILATGTAYTADVFYPAADEWRTETIDLTPYIDDVSLMLVFRNIGYWGQAMYADNINIAVEKESITSHEENISVQVYPNPNNGKCYAIINCDEAVNAELQLLNTVGQVVYQSAANLIPGSNTIYIDARDLPAGVYTMSVKTSTLNISKSIIIE